MNMYRKKSDGGLFSEQQLREGFNGMLPAVFDRGICDLLEVDPMLETPRPATSATQVAYKSGATKDVLGNWVWVWSVRDMTPEELEANKPPIPQEVSRRRGLQAIFIKYGLKEDDIEAAINSDTTLTEAQRYLAVVEFKTSQIFERQRPLVVRMGSALGFDLDMLFVFANTIP